MVKCLEQEQLIENARIKAAQDSRADLKQAVLQRRSVNEALRHATTFTDLFFFLQLHDYLGIAYLHDDPLVWQHECSVNKNFAVYVHILAKH